MVCSAHFHSNSTVLWITPYFTERRFMLGKHPIIESLDHKINQPLMKSSLSIYLFLTANLHLFWNILCWRIRNVSID